jgi:16S rRNA (guanine527-N7)-methyltransferase
LSGPAASVAAAAEQLGLAPTAAQIAALERFLELLVRWNGTYNLTAVREPAAMRTQHLADCLAVVPSVARQLPAGQVLDVGSGGGLPGVVLAVMLPGLQVSCVDAVGKKAAFVRQAAAQLQLPNLAALHSRVEALRASSFDLITSRAFATLADFVRWTRPLLAPGGVWMAMKAKHPADEIAALPPDVTVFHVEPLQVPGLHAERCLIWMRPT